MRILFLCHREHDITIGGVAEFINHLPPALKKYGIESIIYTQSDQPTRDLEGPVTLKNGMRHYSGPFLKPGWFTSRKKLAPLIQLCQREKIDLIHAQGLYRCGYMAMKVNQQTHIPYVVTSHSDILSANSERISRASVQRRCRQILKNATQVTHLTSLMADASHAIFDTSKKSVTIGNGIDIAAWQPFANMPEKNYLLAIGRLEPEKGFHVLIEAYAKLRAQGMKTSLMIAGAGSAEKDLHAQTEKLGLNLITDFQDFSDIPDESVIFTGYIRGDIKKQVMAQSQLVLFATQPEAWEEAFSIVQVETMAAGKAMIASDTAATRYLLSLGLQAHLVEPANTTAWVDAIAHLLSHAELRKKLGAMNWENSQRFDWDFIAEKYAGVYRMRKNILIFGHGYASQFVDINNQYTKLFDPEKYSVTVVYLTGEANEDVRRRHSADQVIFLNAPKKSVRGLKITVIKSMLKLCREKHFDIVICHRYKPTYVMLWVARFCKIPSLFFVMHELGTLSNISRKLLIATLAKKNMYFAGVSDAVRDDMRRAIWNVPHERVITLYNMIDVEATQEQLLDRHSARMELNLLPSSFIFGNIGRLVKNKDQKTLIQAFALIKPKCPNAKLVIAGNGHLEDELKAQVARLHLSHDVIFTGFLRDGFRYMKAFDVYISSSTQEAFGRVLLEAMIAQVPIIATCVNGVPEVIGDTGPLVSAADPEKLAAEMLKSYQSSTAQLQNWGMRGYERAVNDFSLQRFNQVFWQLF